MKKISVFLLLTLLLCPFGLRAQETQPLLGATTSLTPTPSVVGHETKSAAAIRIVNMLDHSAEYKTLLVQIIEVPQKPFGKEPTSIDDNKKPYPYVESISITVGDSTYTKYMKKKNSVYIFRNVKFSKSGNGTVIAANIVLSRKAPTGSKYRVGFIDEDGPNVSTVLFENGQSLYGRFAIGDIHGLWGPIHTVHSALPELKNGPLVFNDLHNGRNRLQEFKISSQNDVYIPKIEPEVHATDSVQVQNIEVRINGEPVVMPYRINNTSISVEIIAFLSGNFQKGERVTTSTRILWNLPDNTEKKEMTTEPSVLQIPQDPLLHERRVVKNP